MFLFVETTNENTDILNVSTLDQGSTSFKVELKDSVFHFDKLQGYKIVFVDSYKYDLVFDQKKYDAYLAAQKKEQEIKDANTLFEELKHNSILKSATDKEAYVMRYLYDEWKAEEDYEVGDRCMYKENLYRCKQEHISQAQHTPDLIPAIWDIVNADETKGTIDNPIPVPESFSSMVYVKGKYYSEAGKLYLMNREGMRDGEEISLAYKPSALVGQYFAIAHKSPVDTQQVTVPEFKQPTGAHDAYKKGDVVMYKGSKYESLIDNNVHAPDAYAQGWKKLV